MAEKLKAIQQVVWCIFDGIASAHANVAIELCKLPENASAKDVAIATHSLMAVALGDERRIFAEACRRANAETTPVPTEAPGTGDA